MIKKVSKDVEGVRLRVPDRSQVEMTIQSPDDLIGEDHPARVVWAVVEQMDLSAFHTPIMARQGGLRSGLDRPASASGSVAVRHHPGCRLGA